MNADEPIDNQDSSDKDDSPEGKVEQAVEAIAEDYLKRLRKGESESYDDLVRQHPDLAPFLESKLKFYLAVYRATRLTLEGDASDDVTVDFSIFSSPPKIHRDHVYRINCPHCGNQVQVVDDRVREIVCASCGSSVRVHSDVAKKLSEKTPPPMPEQLGHFRIVRMLGEGGFGVVYLGEDLQLDLRPVAIKIPRHGFFATSEEEQRFFREARNVARLRHPNIAQVYDISEDRNTPFIVSEFIDGMTLRELLGTGTLTHKESVKLMIQIAEAIEFAHRSKIIHRDLKTSNILVDHNHRAYVVDFGLSRRDDAEITMTVDGAIVGTVQYMSPEQAIGNQTAVGPCSDIYSLGVILYELLCKELPFHGSKRMVIEQVINEEPRSLHRLNESVPRDLETITLKAMAKKPSQRYSSAQALADDLGRWLRGEPIQARPISNIVRYWSWCRRHPVTASLSAMIAVLLLLTAAISMGWAFEQNRLTLVAKKSQRESEDRRYELLMQNGTNALEGNDLVNASLWFADALTTRESQANRTRLGMIQDRIPKLTQLWATGFPVDAVRFNQDGTRLAAVNFDGRIQVYNTLNQKSVFDQTVHRFTQFTTSPTCDKIAFCGAENHAQLWDVDRNRLIKNLAHTDYVVSTDFHSSGQWLVTGSFDSFARVWNTSDGMLKAERQFEGLQVNQVVCVPQSNLVVVVANPTGQTGGKIQVWDFENDKIVASGMNHDAHIQAIDFAENGTRICSASRDGQIRIWDLATGKAVGGGLKLPFAPREVLFGGSAEEVVSISHDFDIQIWSLTTGQRLGSQIRGLSHYESADQDRSNRLLVLGGGDGSVNIYWRKTGKHACSLLRNSESATATGFHPDGRRLAVAGRNGVLQIWDLAGAAPTSHVFQHQGTVRNALFSPDGNRCLSVGSDGKGYIWNTDTGQQMGAVLEHAEGISECAISSDGKLVATAGVDKLAKLWDGYSGNQLGGNLIHESAVLTLAFSPDGQRLVAGCIDGSVTSWNIPTPSNPNPSTTPVFVGKHEDRVMSIAYSLQGDAIASASLDGTVRYWDAVTGQQKYGPFAHPHSALFCTFMPDGEHVLSTGTNGWVYIWNLTSGQAVHRLECAGEVLSATVQEAGRQIWTNESKGRTRSWRLRDGVMQNEFEVHHPSIESVSFCDVNRKGSLLAFAGGTLAQASDIPQSGAAILWDLTEQRLLAPPLTHLQPIRRVYFDKTGSKLLTASRDHTARLWTILSNELPANDAMRIAQLYAQLVRDPEGRLRTLAPDLQVAEFTELSGKYPNYFRCDADEIELWNEDSRRIYEAISEENNRRSSGNSVRIPD